MLLLGCSPAADPRLGTYGFCPGNGAAYNLKLESDGVGRWAIDGCDYTFIGSGTWSSAAGDAFFHTSSEPASGGQFRPDTRYPLSFETTEQVRISTPSGEQLWTRGGLCAGCRPQRPCIPCEQPPGLDL